MCNGARAELPTIAAKLGARIVAEQVPSLNNEVRSGAYACSVVNMLYQPPDVSPPENAQLATTLHARISPRAAFTPR